MASVAAGLVLLVGGLAIGQEDATYTVGLVADETLGTYIVDEEGRTLYRFLEDEPGRSACEGDCEQRWPVVHLEELRVPPELDVSKFGELLRDDGTLQSTFLGWPLYRFADDAHQGDANGHGLNDAWFTLNPANLDPLVSGWMLVDLVDTLTGEGFRIADFHGRPVLIESFAVWCSTCLRQQKEMAKLVESEGEAIVHVSLDTDPNEDSAAVRGHAERHGFEWFFAISPISLTETLIDEFGLTVVNAPRAPVILVQPDGSAHLLRNGVKSADKLIEEIGGGPG